MFANLLKVSRPRFWMYTIGPYLIGIGSSMAFNDAYLFNPNILWWLLFFSFPANLFLYGMNDIADSDTDKFNSKKGTYEAKVLDSDKKNIVFASMVGILLFLPLYIQSSKEELIFFAVFIIFALAYSLPPIRFKAVPFVDSLSNGVLYTMAGLMGYFAAGGEKISLFPYLSAFIWASVMHAYSAIPDIEADGKAGISTIATVLGSRKTLFLCLLSYMIIGLLMIISGHQNHAILVVPYMLLIFQSFRDLRSKSDVFSVYKVYPYVTYVIGALTYALAVNFK